MPLLSFFSKEAPMSFVTPALDWCCSFKHKMLAVEHLPYITNPHTMCEECSILYLRPDLNRQPSSIESIGKCNNPPVLSYYPMVGMPDLAKHINTW